MSATAILRECHRLRLHIRELLAEIDRGPRILREHEQELEDARAAHQAHFDAITKLKLKQREDEGSLKQTESRLAKLEDQLTGITVQKEYTAKLSEIEQAKAKKSALEDAILATIMELEEKTAATAEVEKQWSLAQVEFQRFRAEAAERLERMKNDLEVSQAELARYEAELPPDLKRVYDSLVKAKGPDALAGARNRICQGCRTAMTEAEFLELRRGEYRICTRCGRLLYPVE
jgi:predicted  nucleic acid-binding Zn-ribbon protein